MQEHHETDGVAVLECEECGRPWREPRERWRAYVTEDERPETVTYCPECALREFGT